MEVKKIIEKYPVLFKYLTHLYNVIIGKNRIKKKGNNDVNIGIAVLKKCSINIDGVNNKIIIDDLCRLENCQISIIGNDCTLIISRRNYLSKAEFWMQQDGSSIILREHVTMHGPVHVASTEGCSIAIGEDCMFANDIQVRNGDSHAIYCNDERINHAKDISIGKHVWICAGAMILKGSTINDNCIVGAKSLVTSNFIDESVIIAGNPAKVKKRNISWERDLE